MNTILKQASRSNRLQYCFYTLCVLFLTACKKGHGAICNDGSRSYSTGRGTCSWHGGVDYYLDPNEVDVGSTIGLIVFLVIVAYVVIKLRK
jgi:hypothetical protein